MFFIQYSNQKVKNFYTTYKNELFEGAGKKTAAALHMK